MYCRETIADDEVDPTLGLYMIYNLSHQYLSEDHNVQLTEEGAEEWQNLMVSYSTLVDAESPVWGSTVYTRVEEKWTSFSKGKIKKPRRNSGNARHVSLRGESYRGFEVS